MSHPLNEIMERASRALVQMDYLTCETLCLEALTLARTQSDWASYARILLPLQEARRQRRQIAADGVIRLGTSDLPADSPAIGWLDQIQRGCMVVTHPHTVREAAELHDQARRARMHIEVLFADNASDASTWRLRSFAGPEVTCDLAAPRRELRDRWLPTGEAGAAEWFLRAAEALGDAALAQSPSHDVEHLEALLSVAPDHEILHQRLAAAARARGRSGADH